MKHDVFEGVMIVQVRDCTLEHVKGEVQLFQTRKTCEDVEVYRTLETVVIEVEVFKRYQ